MFRLNYHEGLPVVLIHHENPVERGISDTNQKGYPPRVSLGHTWVVPLKVRLA